MATNKHAIIRYQTLDKCFSNPGRRYFIDDLIEACNQAIYNFTGKQDGVKRRQIFEDIKFMESPQGWSVELKRQKEAKKVYYRYVDFSFSINNRLLNINEEHQLKEVLFTLSRFKGMPQFKWIEEIVIRLESSFSNSNKTNNYIEFEQNPFLQGLDFFLTIFNAIIYKKVLAVDYKSFKNSDATKSIFHPYYLKQYNGRWFVFGKTYGFDKITNLALDRVETISELAETYIENELINFEEYFDDVVGVSIPDDSVPQKVILKVSVKQWPYIKTKPIHGSQKIKEITEEYTIIELFIIVNFELISLLFSYGENIIVLEPKSLALEIKTKAFKLMNNYL